MRILIIVLLWTSITYAQGLPPKIAAEIQGKEPVVMQVMPVDAITVLAALHYPESKLWVLTYLHMIAVDKWRFETKDILSIMEEKDGIAHEIWKRLEDI